MAEVIIDHMRLQLLARARGLTAPGKDLQQDAARTIGRQATQRPGQRMAVDYRLDVRQRPAAKQDHIGQHGAARDIGVGARVVAVVVEVEHYLHVVSRKNARDPRTHGRPGQMRKVDAHRGWHTAVEIQDRVQHNTHSAGTHIPMPARIG